MVLKFVNGMRAILDQTFHRTYFTEYHVVPTSVFVVVVVVVSVVVVVVSSCLVTGYSCGITGGQGCDDCLHKPFFRECIYCNSSRFGLRCTGRDSCLQGIPDIPTCGLPVINSVRLQTK